MELFAVEIRTAKWQQMLDWYSQTLLLECRLRSEEDGYALLAGEGWRLALLRRLEESTADRGAISLAIQVENLERVYDHVKAFVSEREDSVQTSDEGFLQWTVTDPDGNRVKLFQFVH